ncbi:MAG TPA: hydantoinase B/oxoprolinase family protein, partial [Alphaproteobacteria bacterium]
IEEMLDDALVPRMEARLDGLAGEARAALRAQGINETDIAVARRAHIRYRGTDTALIVPFGDRAALARAFAEAHARRFGFTMAGTPLVVEAVSVEAVGASGAGGDPARAAEAGEASPVATAQAHIEGKSREVPVFLRARLGAGAEIDGPAILVEDGATTVIEPGWRARVTERGHLVMRRAEPLPRPPALGTGADPVLLEVFNNLFMSIAEEMGVALANTAQSVNIKERLDFSCAVFDGDGRLIANAPHMPVHLGSMGESVRAVIRRSGAAAARPGAPDPAARARPMGPGDVYVHNAPYDGGTHLPDITVIRPVYGTGEDRPMFFVAARGHHADIGGTHPGSMPPASTSIDEEGILFEGDLLVDGGVFREEALRARLAAGPWPVRNPDQNVADLKAQVAACARGADELDRMVETFGLDVVRAYMGHVQDNAEEAVRGVIARLEEGAFAVPMDDGGTIRVAVSVDRGARAATVDFTGTSGPSATNFNAPAAVTRACVLYAFRALVAEPIPMNDGCLRPIRIVIPEGSLLAPVPPAAVVAGNVETSQCIVDAILAAVGRLAASQGTMNNVTFGDARYQYYETLCGGAGAGPGFDGASAVHTHMTNSRLTDAEVLEWRYPVLIERFAIRRGSGGEGRWRGGDGVVRRIRFREAMAAAVLSNRRRTRPFGLCGGEGGLAGVNRVERTDGTVETLGPTAEVAVGPGDVLVIETPGGGGYGARD